MSTPIANDTTAPPPLGQAARNPAPVIEITAKNVNDHGGVFCPSPQAGMPIWNNHPRVFIDVAHLGEGRCPYCGTIYRLKAGEKLKRGH